MKATIGLEERCKEVLEMLIESLGLDDVDRGTIDYTVPLFASEDQTGTGLELDSVDALEIVVSIKSTYGLKMGDSDKKALYSIQTIAEFINANVSEVA